jgi:2-methylisocitrate lyase-like PEP mutase family enzyme
MAAELNRSTLPHARETVHKVAHKVARAVQPGLNRRLRELLQPGAGVMMPGVANGLAARLVAHVGFETLIVSGAGIANFSFGLPDLGLTTASELGEHVAMIRDTVEIPIVVDADTGFGGPLNVRRTIRMLERAGANGIMIEDQVAPKRCGHFDGKDVIPKAEMVQKIHAAVDARIDPDLVIVARTDARAVHGLDDALERAAAYQEAGADVLFVEAPLSLEELTRIPREVPAPHFSNMVFGGRTPLQGRDALAELGFATVICANAALQAAMRGMLDVLRHLKTQGTLAGAEALMVSFTERQELVDKASFDTLSQRYRTPDD